MARFCTECGTEIRQGVAFCTECGNRVPVEPESTAVEAPSGSSMTAMEEPREMPRPQSPRQPEEFQNNPRQWTPPAPAPTPAPPAPVRTPPAPAENQTVSTGAYFGLMLLFALPVVGFISCIIFSFAPQNPNLKHFARANLIWAIIGLVLGAILVGGLFLLGGTVLQQLEMTGEQLPLWEELLGGYGIP